MGIDLIVQLLNACVQSFFCYCKNTWYTVYTKKKNKLIIFFSIKIITLLSDEVYYLNNNVFFSLKT